MGLKIEESEDAFLAVRSTVTGKLYVVMLEAGRDGEALVARSLSELVGGGSRVLGPADKPVKERRVFERANPGETMAKVAAVMEDGVERTIGDIAEAGGMTRGGVQSALVALQRSGKVGMRQEPRPDNPSLVRNLYKWGAETEVKLSPRDDIVLKLVTEHGPVSARGINERNGRDPKNTDVYTSLRKLERAGMIGAEKVANPDDPAHPMRVFQAKEPSGPEASSQRSSEPQGSSSEGL